MELLVNGYISAVVGILSRLVAIETFRWVVEIPNSGFASNFELTSSWSSEIPFWDYLFATRLNFCGYLSFQFLEHYATSFSWAQASDDCSNFYACAWWVSSSFSSFFQSFLLYRCHNVSWYANKICSLPCSLASR